MERVAANWQLHVAVIDYENHRFQIQGQYESAHQSGVAIIRAYLFTAVIVSMYAMVAVVLCDCFRAWLIKAVDRRRVYLAAVLFVGVSIVNFVASGEITMSVRSIRRALPMRSP